MNFDLFLHMPNRALKKLSFSEQAKNLCRQASCSKERIGLQKIGFCKQATRPALNLYFFNLVYSVNRFANIFSEQTIELCELLLVIPN